MGALCMLLSGGTLCPGDCWLQAWDVFGFEATHVGYVEPSSSIGGGSWGQLVLTQDIDSSTFFLEFVGVLEKRFSGELCKTHSDSDLSREGMPLFYQTFLFVSGKVARSSKGDEIFAEKGSQKEKRAEKIWHFGKTLLH